MGCLLGLIVGADALPTDPRATRWIRAAGVVGGAGLIAYVVFGSWQDSWNYRGGLTLVALAAVAVVAATLTAPAGPAAKVLAFAPLVVAGPDLVRRLPVALAGVRRAQRCVPRTAVAADAGDQDHGHPGAGLAHRGGWWSANSCGCGTASTPRGVSAHPPQRFLPYKRVCPAL